MQVKYLDLAAQYHTIKPEVDRAIQGVIDSSAFVLGPAVASFEEAFAGYCEASHCAGVNNGTNALLLALRALGVGPGDEVVTAANTFIATCAAIAHAGARPVLVDIDPETRNLDPNLLSMAISRKTRAIIPVHLYGRPADMDPINQIAERHGVPVLEDSAQAHGARYRGKRTGSLGHAAAFSFYPGKNLGAYGEGGAVVTNDAKVNEMVRKLRDHGSESKYVHSMVGYNARLEGIQGAVLGVKLRYLDRWSQARVGVARRYNELLAGAPVKTPRFDDDIEQVFHLYVIETDRRDALQKYLSEQGVSTLIHYPVPVHLQAAFDYLGYRKGDFPVCERSCEQVLSLPIYAEIPDDQVAYVADRIKAFFGAT